MDDLFDLLDSLDVCLRIHRHGGARGCLVVALIFIARLAGLGFVIFSPRAMARWPFG